MREVLYLPEVHGRYALSPNASGRVHVVTVMKRTRKRGGPLKVIQVIQQFVIAVSKFKVKLTDGRLSTKDREIWSVHDKEAKMTLERLPREHFKRLPRVGEILGRIKMLDTLDRYTAGLIGTSDSQDMKEASYNYNEALHNDKLLGVRDEEYSEVTYI